MNEEAEKDRITFSMRPSVVWTAILLIGGGNAAYTNMRPEPAFTHKDRAKILMEVEELRVQLRQVEERRQASIMEMRAHVGSLQQTCSFVRSDLEELKKSGSRAMNERLDSIQQQLNKCLR